MIDAYQSKSMSLRAFLRDETRVLHEAVDVAFSDYSLTERPSYSRFLSAHYQALTSVAPGSPFGLPPIDALAFLESDLDTLGMKPISGTPQTADDDYRLGCYYVLAGSQAGAKILRKRWRESIDPTVLQAGSYLDASAQANGWAAFRSLDPPPQLDWTKALLGASNTFEAFRQAAYEHAPAKLKGSRATGLPVSEEPSFADGRSA